MASTSRVVALTACGALAWACSGDLTGGRDGAVAPGDASIGLDARISVDAARLPDGRIVEGVDGGGTIETDAGIEIPIDAGPCVGTTLAEMVSITPVVGASASGSRLFGAATPSGGAVIAQRGGSGVVLRRVDGAGAPVGGDVTVAGNDVWGLAINDSTWTVIVDRGGDELFLAGVGPAGESRFEQRFLGGVPHDVTNNEWFGTQLRAGRLAWTGSQWAAYVTVQRLWPDGVAHYGDTLRYFGESGAPEGAEWDWGCSHSMEVGVAHNGTRIGPVCVSDCYPEKGVFFAHRTPVFGDPSGDCAGRIDTRLGGIAAVADGFWLAFSTPHTRASYDVAIAHVGNDGVVGSIVWITADSVDDGAPRIAPYAGGILLGWDAGGSSQLLRIDGSGAALGSPVAIAEGALGAASDFFAHASGDVGWVQPTGGGLSLGRVRACL